VLAHVVRSSLIVVRNGKFAIRNLKRGPAHAAIAATVKFGIHVPGLATCGYELRVFDLNGRAFKSNKCISLPLEPTAENGQLHRILLESSIGKQ
jgi:hypothetical protein